MDLERGLRVLEGRARAVKLLLGTYVAFAAVLSGGFLTMLTLGLDFNDQQQPVVEAVTYGVILMLAVFVACVIAVCLWTYRAHANLRAAGRDDLTFTPGSAVGWYFVPVAMLFNPFRAMRELWNASHMANDIEHSRADTRVVIWWALWLLGGFASRAAGTLETSSVLDIVANVLMGGSALCLLLIVAQITRAQTQELNASYAFA